MGTWNTYWSGVAPDGAGSWWMNPTTGMWSYGTPPAGAITQQQFQQGTMAGQNMVPAGTQDLPAGGFDNVPGKFFDDNGQEWDNSTGRSVKTGVFDPLKARGYKAPVAAPPVVSTPSSPFSTREYNDSQVAAQSQLLQAKPQGDPGVRGGVPTDSRGLVEPPIQSPFSPSTDRIAPPVAAPPPAPGGGNPASTQPPPAIQYPPTPTPTPPTGITAPPPPGRGDLPGGGIPPVAQPGGGAPPASQGGGANPASGFPGVPRWDAAFAGANPFTSSGVTGGIGGTPVGVSQPTTQGAPQSPFGGSSGANPSMGQMLAGGTPQGSSADSWMSQLAQGSTDALQSIIGGKGNPIDQTPAWEAMIKAQQRNIDTGQARLNAQFDVSGNRFSNAFGTAATDYQNQTVLDQNALLGQMTAQAGESAQGRLLNAGSTMAGLGAGAASQLSGQDFQSIMQQYGISADMAKYLGGGADTAASQLAGLGAAGSNALYGGSMAGANALFGGENSAAQSMYGAQNSTLPAFMNYLMGGQQQGLGAASDLSQLWNANLQTGAGIGQQQYTDQQSAINNAYQEWLRTQPTNNPLLSMMFSGATGYPQMYNPSYQPGILGSLLGSVGQIGGALAGRQ